MNSPEKPKSPSEILLGGSAAAKALKEMTTVADRMKEMFPPLPALPSFSIPKIDPAAFKPPMMTIAEANYASEFYKHLVEQINDFDDELDPEYEVGLRLVSFGQSVSFHVRDLGYQNPSLIFFFGETDRGQPVQLIQHVSQISFLLMKVKRPDPTQPKRPIGFHREKVPESGGEDGNA